MATKQNFTNSISNTASVTSNSFTKNSNGYYTGMITISAADGYYFDLSVGQEQITSNSKYKMYFVQNGNNRLLTAFYVSRSRTKTVDGVTYAVEIRFQLFASDSNVGDTAFNLPWIATGNALKIPTAQTEITVNTNLQNCTISGLPQTVYDNTILNLTITAENGFNFETAPYLRYLDDNSGNYETLNFTLSSDNLTATLTKDLSELKITDNAIYINANAVEIVEPQNEISVTTNLQNCAISGLPQTVYSDTVLNLTISANTDFSFATTPKLQFSQYVLDDNGNIVNEINFNLSNDNKTATLNLNLSEYNLDYLGTYPIITITATAAADTPQPQSVNVITQITNCTISGLPQTVYTDTVLNLTITADTNTLFELEPQILILDHNGNPHTVNAVLNTAATVATFTNLDLSIYTPNEIRIFASATVQTAAEKYGTINVYKVDENILKQFAEKRFFVENIASQNDTPNYIQIDLGGYVVSVKRIYCNINELQNDVIKCGNYNTNISAQAVLNDNIIINCGNITITAVNNSGVDYQSEINLFLPFVGFVSISNDYLNKELNLQYIVNVITTNAVVNIIYNNNIVLQYECNLSNDIIFNTPQQIGAIKQYNNLDFNMNVLKGLQPYALLKYYTDENKALYNSDNFRAELNTLNGFNKVIELTNFSNENIKTIEYNEILNELQNGIYF